MPNARIVYDNRADAADLIVPDALPTLPAQAMQRMGRMSVCRLHQIKGMVSSTVSCDLPTGALAPTAATVAGWFRSGSSASAYVELRPYDTTGGRYLSVNCVNGVISANFNGQTTSGQSVSYGTWAHAAAAWTSGGLLRLYVNGTQLYTIDPTDDPSLSGNNPPNQYLQASTVSSGASGGVARPSWWARELSASEIAALAKHQDVSDEGLLERLSLQDNTIGDLGNTFSSASSYISGPGASGAANVVQIKGNWAQSESVNCIALVRCNLTSASTVRVRLYSAVDQGGSTLYDSSPSGLVSVISGTRSGNYTTIALYTSSLVSGVRSFLIEINNGTTPVDVARLVIGQYWEPSRNALYGAQLGFVDTGFSARTEGAALIGETGSVYRTARLVFGRIGASERDALSALLYAASNTREVWVSLWPAENNSQREIDHSMCAAAATRSMTHDLPSNYVTELNLEET